MFPKQCTYDDVIAHHEDAHRPVFLDVRELHEWQSGHIEGAMHIPLGQLEERVGELDAKQQYVVVCHGGVRSNTACWFLSEQGYAVTNLLGGMLQWEGRVV